MLSSNAAGVPVEIRCVQDAPFSVKGCCISMSALHWFPKHQFLIPQIPIGFESLIWKFEPIDVAQKPRKANLRWKRSETPNTFELLKCFQQLTKDLKLVENPATEARKTACKIRIPAALQNLNHLSPLAVPIPHTPLTPDSDTSSYTPLQIAALAEEQQQLQRQKFIQQQYHQVICEKRGDAPLGLMASTKP